MSSSSSYFRSLKINSILLNSILILVAVTCTLAVFLADIYSPPELSIGVLYCVVIIYSWLLPGQASAIITGLICTLLIIAAPFAYQENSPHMQSAGINQLISLVSTWVCVALVTLAKRSFNELDQIIGNMENKVKEKTRELRMLNLTLEDKVSDRTKELEAINQELEQFAYVTSHDLQEPVNTIRSFAELLLEDKSAMLDDEAQLYLQHMIESGDRMSELIRDLLDYSRIGRNDKPSLVNCNEILKSVLHDLESKIKDSGTLIKIQNLPKIHAYQIEMRMLFQNLISNAIKFRKPNVTNQVKIHAKENTKEWIFCVEDNGIGIPLKYQKNIFTIFKRLHDLQAYEGTGIGLAHCKKIVELHNGKLWIDSEEGRGSKFYFSIPKVSLAHE